jgi:hypothetical protein
MPVADRLGTRSPDTPCAALCPTRGHPAAAPARLALATVLPCAAGLSERPAAAAVRRRMDGPYGLGLDLPDPGFHPTGLREFRTRLVAGAAAHLRLATLLTLARTQGLRKTRGRSRTDSPQGWAAIRVRTRLERVGEPLRAALHSLAVVAPAWGQPLAPPEWEERSAHRVENSQLRKTAAARQTWAPGMGTGGQR